METRAGEGCQSARRFIRSGESNPWRWRRWCGATRQRRGSSLTKNQEKQGGREGGREIGGQRPAKLRHTTWLGLKGRADLQQLLSSGLLSSDLRPAAVKTWGEGGSLAPADAHC